jgi:hypothetical protein
MMLSQLLVGGDVLGIFTMYVLLLGYFSQVVKGAIIADQAQLPQAKDAPSALGLGCMGSFFLWAAVFALFSGAAIRFGSVQGWDQPSAWMVIAVPTGLWFLCSIWTGMIYSHYRPDRKEDSGNFMVINAFKIFFQPPLSLDGVVLALLTGLAAASAYLLRYPLSPCIPLCFLLAHCVGQYLRKRLGFELR